MRVVLIYCVVNLDVLAIYSVSAFKMRCLPVIGCWKCVCVRTCKYLSEYDRVLCGRCLKM